MQASEFLRDLRREVEEHPAVNHVFLMRVSTTPFTREDYKVFGLDHYPLVGTFCRYMEHLLLRAPDSESKSWIAKVLVDEYGKGSDGEDHAHLYGKYLTACGVGPGEEDTEPLDPRVADFIGEHLRIVTEEPFLVGIGALGPGHEWSIPRMFVPIIDGLRRAGFTEREIQYFTLHTLQEQDHGRWLEEALVRMVRTPEQAAQVRGGAMLSMPAQARPLVQPRMSFPDAMASTSASARRRAMGAMRRLPSQAPSNPPAATAPAHDANEAGSAEGAPPPSRPETEFTRMNTEEAAAARRASAQPAKSRMGVRKMPPPVPVKPARSPSPIPMRSPASTGGG